MSTNNICFGREMRNIWISPLMKDILIFYCNKGYQSMALVWIGILDTRGQGWVIQIYNYLMGVLTNFSLEITKR